MADTAKPKKKREMLTSFSIIFILLAIVAVITIMLNGKSYTINGEEGTVVAATLSDFLMSPVRGFADAIDVCLFVMVLGKGVVWVWYAMFVDWFVRTIVYLAAFRTRFGEQRPQADG